MPRAKRSEAQRSARIHDRKAQDLPLNAEVAEVEVDDPLALEPGEKIVTLRSIRNDPLARLHSHHQIDEAQFRGGRAFQDDWEKAERGPRAVDPTREYVDASPSREPITERQRRAVLRLNRASRELGADGAVLVHEVLILGLNGENCRAARSLRPALDGLSLEKIPRMPGSAGVDLRLCDAAEIGGARRMTAARSNAGNSCRLQPYHRGNRRASVERQRSHSSPI
jgi:hypothetical protein